MLSLYNYVTNKYTQNWVERYKYELLLVCLIIDKMSKVGLSETIECLKNSHVPQRITPTHFGQSLNIERNYEFVFQ